MTHQEKNQSTETEMTQMMSLSVKAFLKAIINMLKDFWEK